VARRSRRPRAGGGAPRPPHRAAHLDALVAARASTWAAAERAALAAVIETLSPSPRHLAEILDWLEDVAARDGTCAGAVLAERSLAAALRARGSAPDRLKRWKEALRRLRYPRLAAREAAIGEAIRALGLGPAVGVAVPPGLEGGTLSFTIRARTAGEFAAVLDRLQERLASGDLERLFALLDEA